MRADVPIHLPRPRPRPPRGPRPEEDPLPDMMSAAELLLFESLQQEEEKLVLKTTSITNSRSVMWALLLPLVCDDQSPGFSLIRIFDWRRGDASDETVEPPAVLFTIYHHGFRVMMVFRSLLYAISDVCDG